MFFSFQQSRFVTFDNTSTPAALFIKSLPHTGFNKVYRNNMDEESFISDTNDIIQHMFLDAKTAAFLTESAGKSSEEYSNCQVSMCCCTLGKHWSCTVYQPTVTLYVLTLTESLTLPVNINKLMHR